ncbi:MAG TPA: hypothetical protein PLO61_06965 [Fimbriimonadaceae bacterium]|mgnify:CR=1 FL=1|nr:hypothetical protein [Fimbriimonadaceae bacterium]HRJ33263.1 hypothetical protein [Fimbriimonadaceae bacterium]
MQVQPYFPEQEVIEGNVAEAAYDVRIAFLRKVWLGWLGLCFAVGVGVVSVRSPFGDATNFWLMLVLSLALSASRRLWRGTRWDTLTSAVLGALWIPLAAFCIAILRRLDWPVEILAWAAVLPALYGLLCGRDYSFVAQFVMSFSALLVVTLTHFGLGHFDLRTTVLISFWGGVLQFYLVYNLAALLNRRRTDEVLSSVVDFMRDYLNFLTYSLRVIHHWRKFRF